MDLKNKFKVTFDETPKKSSKTIFNFCLKCFKIVRRGFHSSAPPFSCLEAQEYQRLFIIQVEKCKLNDMGFICTLYLFSKNNFWVTFHEFREGDVVSKDSPIERSSRAFKLRRIFMWLLLTEIGTSNFRSIIVA